MRKYRFLFLVIALAISAVAVAAISIGKSEPVVGQKNPQASVLMASIGSSNSATAKTDLDSKGNGTHAWDCFQCCYDKISFCCYDDCDECPRSLFGDYHGGYVYRPCTTVSELE